MARVVVIYRTPRDPAAFDKYYRGTHVPLCKKIPGMRKFEMSKGPIATLAGPSEFYMIATLHFDDMAALQKGFATPEGQAAAADAEKFSVDRLHLLMFDNHEV